MLSVAGLLALCSLSKDPPHAAASLSLAQHLGTRTSVCVSCSQLTACWADNVSSPECAKPPLHHTTTSQCSGPASQPEISHDSFILLWICSNYNCCKTGPLSASPTLVGPLEMCSLKVQLHQPPASLPCSHLPHPLGALYFLPPERMLWLEFHLVLTAALPF